MKRFWTLLAIGIIVAMVFTACGQPAPAPAPSTPKPTQSPAPSPTAAPAPAPAPTSGPAPTAKATVKPMSFKGVAWKWPAPAETQMAQAFAQEIEKKSNGLLKFKILGGIEVIPTEEQPNALLKGVVDFTWASATFAAGILPEANTHTLLRMNNAEERKRGIYDLLNQIYQTKGFYYVTNLDPSTWEQNFLVFTIDKVEKPEDIKGIRMRSIPAYLPLIDAFGAVPIGVALGEVYTALERGLIRGLPFTITSTFDFALQEVLKYYVLPGFGHSQVAFYFNLNVWNTIPPESQKMIKDTLIELEPKSVDAFNKGYEEGFARLDKAGMKRVQFSPADGERFVKSYYDGNWQTIVNKSPANGAKLRELAGLPPLTPKK